LAVNVILTATGGRTFNLKASNYRISLKRYPLQSPLPGKTDGSGTRPVLIIDLYQLVTVIFISGIVENDKTGSDSADELRQAVSTWDIYTPILQIPLRSDVPGSYKKYTGQVESFDLSQESGLEDRYAFNLVFRCSTNEPTNVT